MAIDEIQDAAGSEKAGSLATYHQRKKSGAEALGSLCPESRRLCLPRHPNLLVALRLYIIVRGAHDLLS